MTTCPLCGGTMNNAGPILSNTASSSPPTHEWWDCQSCPYAVAVAKPVPATIHIVLNGKEIARSAA